MKTEEDWLSIADAAVRLGVSRPCVSMHTPMPGWAKFVPLTPTGTSGLQVSTRG